MKSVKVEYIESGAFVGGEEAVFNAGFKTEDDLVVVRAAELADAKEALAYCLRALDSIAFNSTDNLSITTARCATAKTKALSPFTS